MELIPTQKALERGDPWAIGLLAIRIAKVRTELSQGRFDQPHIVEMHRRMFAGFTADAGILIGGETVKNKALSGGLVDWLAKMPGKAEFCTSMASVAKGFEGVRLFSLGDATVKREFLVGLSVAAGYTLNLQKIKPEAWAKARTDLARGQEEQMRMLFERAATPTRALAFESLSRDKATAKFPELADAYSFLDMMNKSMENVSGPVKGNVMRAAIEKLTDTLKVGHIPKNNIGALQRQSVIKGPTPKF